MNRKIKILVTWNIVLTTVLFLSVIANASFVQAAADPPVKVFTASAQDIRGGGNTGGVVNLDSTTQKTLVSVNATLNPNHGHVCAVIGSAIVIRYGTGAGFSNYNIQMDNDAPSTGSRMGLTFSGSDPDAAQKSVTSNFSFANVQGNHTFKMIGAKSAAGGTNVSVNNSTLSVICLKKPFQS